MKNPFKSQAAPDIRQIEPVASNTPSAEEKTASSPDVSAKIAELEQIQKAHQFDPNLPQEKLTAVKKALEDGDAQEILEADELFTNNSPYEEVRSAVRNTDGGEVANTIRAWVLGMFFVTIGSGLNMFLSMR